MPIYEATRRRSGLTLQQKREQEAALYGLALEDMSPSNNLPLTASEIDRMRQIVSAHDATNRAPNREFDLNNPPKEPYRHQEFPKMLYDHDQRKNRVVHNKSEERDALKAGLRAEPFSAEAPAADDYGLDDADRSEIDALLADIQRRKAAARRDGKKLAAE